LTEAAEEARRAGLVSSETGGPVARSKIHAILRNGIYTGEFEWKGHLYKGRHEPSVARELWERVQGVLDGRNEKNTRRGPANSPSQGS
jgi:site-specific DNA recombinase